MKILSMAWSIYDDKLQMISKNCTGGNLMIKNICEYIGRIHESYLFIGCSKIQQFDLGHIHIVGTDFIPDVEEYSNNNEKHIKTMTKAFKYVIETLKPDIVNFHGIGVLMQYCIKICINKNIPYVYTDHLYLGSNADIIGYDTNVTWERNVYNIPGIKIILVSTGMRKKILRDYPNIPPRDIVIIENGTNFIAERKYGNISEKYNLYGKKVLLCVGTINYRKNQCQIVKAFQLLPNDIQNKVKILFCGRDVINGKLQESIMDFGLEDKLIYVGAIDNEKMKEYYTIADGLIMPSYAEGLSIAALEAIAYGLPVIMFEDSECADDLNNENVTCFAEKRSDKSLAEAIKRWLETKWNREYIIEYSKYFTMERVANDYINYYEKRLEEWNCFDGI